MDPNANLKEQLELAVRIYERTDVDRFSWMSERLAKLVIELNAWLEAGGFLPDAWKR